MPSLVSSQNYVCQTSAEIPYWWHVNTQIWWCFLIGSNFQPIRPTTKIWVVKGHQCGLFFLLISQTSFCRETSCGFVKCWLVSQAVIRKGGNDYMNVVLTVCITSILPYYSGTLPYGHLSNTVTSLLWPLFFAGYTFPYEKKPVKVATC